MKKYILEITVFICGAIGMILELIAARVLSPYVGSSNLIWTTIIGIMLTSMSLGYWIGGKKADKNPNKDSLSDFILLGAITASLIPLFETIVVKQLSNISDNLVLVAMASATIVFGIPSFVLATVSPFAVKLVDKEYINVGEVSGRISSLSTIGSIVGTFLGGFFLIPTFGTRTIIFGVVIALLMLSILLHEKKDKKYFLLIAVIAISIIGFQAIGKVVFDRKNSDIIKDVDSEYSRIFVKQVAAKDTTYKTLQVDDGLESYIDEKTGKMGAEYLYYYNLANYYLKNNKSTLMIGGAAYTYPTYYLNNFKDKTIDVSEIDEKMTKLAASEFSLDTNNPRLHIYHQDGRSFLNKATNKYDVILIDAFKGTNAPFELTTYEAMENAKKSLNDNGMVITNIISSVTGSESKFINYEYSTYKKVFDDVKVFKVNKINDNTRQNLILIGFKGNKEVDETVYEQYKNLLDNELKDFSSNTGISTDNYAPIGN